MTKWSKISTDIKIEVTHQLQSLLIAKNFYIYKLVNWLCGIADSIYRINVNHKVVGSLRRYHLHYSILHIDMTHKLVWTHCFPISGLNMNLFTVDPENFSINPCQNRVFNPYMRTYYNVICCSLQTWSH